MFSNLGFPSFFSYNLRLPVTPGMHGLVSLYNSALCITALTLQNCFCLFGNEDFSWPVKRVLGNCSTLSLHFGRTGKKGRAGPRVCQIFLDIDHKVQVVSLRDNQNNEVRK